MSTILRYAIIDALATAAYTALVVAFLFYAPEVFGPDDSPLLPIALLLLFVVSATVTAAAVLGRPALWYLEGRKADAIALTAATLVALLAIAVVLLAVQFAIGR